MKGYGEMKKFVIFLICTAVILGIACTVSDLCEDKTGQIAVFSEIQHAILSEKREIT